MIVYEKPVDLMEGIKTVVERVKKGDTALKKIMRIKNL